MLRPNLQKILSKYAIEKSLVLAQTESLSELNILLISNGKSVSDRMDSNALAIKQNWDWQAGTHC